MTTKILLVITLALILNLSVNAQVGIGTVTPDASSVLDISSTTQGMLAPRMTTTERTAITTPANSLLVYDTTVKAFYYYNTPSTSWVQLSSGSDKRDNFKLVKSATDLADELTAGGGSKYLLTTNTLYEINGTISLSFPIDLNNASINGRDEEEDIFTRAGGVLFEGTTGGHIEHITITAPGGTVFNLNDPSSTEEVSLVGLHIEDSGNIGTLSGFEKVHMTNIEFERNNAGIIFSDTEELTLRGVDWHSDNAGIYETFVGDFDLITIESGVLEVIGATAGLDITGITSIGEDAILEAVVFSGGGNYINGASPYIGSSFTNDWTVNAPGISQESDDVSTGNFYYNGSLTTGFSQSISNNTAVKVDGGAGTTTANSLFRFSAPSTNNLTYLGKKTRNFQINASLSVRVVGAAGNFYAFIIAKNGTVVTESNAVVRIDSDSEIQNVAINSIVSLATNDHIEIYVQRLTGGGTDTLAIFSENLSIN
tara:strand:+ start:642 stop:2090 length:1449 start_codon:yes stop_codon:yes gene_type:complete